MTYQWVYHSRDFIARRYDRIAGFISFFDWLLFIPPTFRRDAVNCLNLGHGAKVLEIGCGTGLNLPYLREAVGPLGRVYGVDLSAGMLKKADKLRQRHNWKNVELIQADVADFVAPEPLDGVLFGFSYNTIPHHLTILTHVWKQLRPGGHLVIMDSRVPTGWCGKLALPLGVWLMKHTLLGNPFIRPWEHVAVLADDVSMKEYLFGVYYICHASKPAWGTAPLQDASLHDPDTVDAVLT